MPQRSSVGRGGGSTAVKGRPGNQTPNTPQIRESEIRQLRMDELRSQLQERGVTGISAMRKDELVKTLVKTLRQETRGGAGRGVGRGAGRREVPARKAAAEKAATARTAAGRPAAGKKAAPEKAAARKAPAGKAAPKKAAARKAPAAGKAAPARKAAARKAPTAGKAAPARKAAGGKAAGGKAVPGRKVAGPSGVRTGRGSSKTLRYAQAISSPQDQPDRPGRTLVTTNHEVIQQWAARRQAEPASVEGSEYDGRPGVLGFDFPGWGGQRLRKVSWDDWFRTFDERGLNFLYQEQLSDGRQSNFFRLENPEREDA